MADVPGPANSSLRAAHLKVIACCAAHGALLTVAFSAGFFSLSFPSIVVVTFKRHEPARPCYKYQYARSAFHPLNH
jgi:hypothetical protein